jgi:pimeloyl-ACP methyl ester carboxylesterase
MIRTCRLALVCLLALSPARAAAQSDRFEVGQRLRAFEAAWEAHPDAAARKRALKAVQGVVAQFFKGRYDEAARILAEAGNALRAEKEPPAEVLWAQSLSVRLGPRLADATPRELGVALEPFYKTKAEAPKGAALRLTLLATDGKTVLASHEAPIRALPLRTPLPLKGPRLAEGDHLLRAEVVANGKVLHATPDQTVSLAANLTERLAALGKGVKALPAQTATADALTLRELVGVLGALADGATLETSYPAARLLREAEAALKDVQAGKTHFGGGKTGQFWLRLPAGSKSGTAVRLLAPDATRPGKPLPLVIALHGAGGSENLFFDGYGKGEIVRLCRKRGWLLVAPRTEGFSFSAPVPALIDAVNALYPVDRKRVFVVGHSMGAIQAVKAAQDAPERIAAVAALGGGGWFKASEGFKAIAFFVGVGTRDTLMGSSVRALKKGLLAAGVKTVVYREYPEVEHMLVVPVALPEVFALFDKLARR